LNDLSVSELAYLAGIFDGEGWVGFYLSKRVGHSATVAIANTDFRLFRWIEARVATLGQFRVKPAKGNRKAQWEWTIRSRPDVVTFLTAIRPFLVVKADQADALLSLLDVEQSVIRRGQGVRLSPEVLAMRVVAEREIKAMKRAPTQNIH
jgi:hypothetical protein